ncbi:hypothetical protein, partial [Rhodobacter lacus]
LARATADSAMAAQIATVSASLGTVSASVATQGTAIADLEGAAQAGFLIEAQAGGVVSLLQLIAADGSGGTASVAKISARDILLDGSVYAAQLATGTITAASGIIADAAITRAKIADLAVTEAKIASAAITTAKIGDLAVSTLKIADQAVTIPTGAYTAASLNVSPSTAWQVIQTITYTSTGAPVMLDYAFGAVGTSAGTLGIRLRRGTTTIYDSRAYLAGSVAPFAGGVLDAPTATGARTYTLEVQNPSMVGLIAENRSLRALEVKK